MFLSPDFPNLDLSSFIPSLYSSFLLPCLDCVLTVPVVCQTQYNQPVKRGDYPVVVSVRTAPPSVLCAVLDLTI